MPIDVGLDEVTVGTLAFVPDAGVETVVLAEGYETVIESDGYDTTISVDGYETSIPLDGYDVAYSAAKTAPGENPSKIVARI